MNRLSPCLVALLCCSAQPFALADYTKISNSGQSLPATATLGTGATDWACTYDTTTQLTWEVKTANNGLRDQSWSYSWFNTSSADGNAGAASGSKNCATTGRCDTEKYTQDVNGQGLCGSNDWRLPSNTELKSLVFALPAKTVMAAVRVMRSNPP